MLIQASDVWALWMVLTGCAAVSIYLEQRYKWAATISGAMIALLLAMILANLRVIPTESHVYDDVWNYVVPLAVPLLLFHADVRKIWRESGRSFGAFHISALGTILGTMLATLLFCGQIPELKGISAMFSASYIGGSVNYAAMKDTYQVSSELASAGVVADNLLMSIYFLVLMVIPSLPFFQKHYPHPLQDQIAGSGQSSQDQVVAYWGRQEISLLDIATTLAVAVTIVTVSVKTAAFIAQSGLPEPIRMFLGQKYLLITTVSLVAATLWPRFFEKLRGAKELGMFMIYLFFVVVGVPASIPLLIQKSPLLFAYAAIIVGCNMVVTLGLGKLFGCNLEELLVCSNASIGGPTTAAAMAVAKGWNDLVIPALLVGVWGYAIGNYCGILMATFMGWWLGL
jgi:uncharacterized membrane protein